MLTIRQNLLETIHGGNPDRFVNQYEFLKIIQNPLSLHNPRPPRGGADIPNAWGVTYSWPEHVVASFPVHTPEKVVIKDITHWRDYVHAPNIKFPEAEWESFIAQAEAVDRSQYYVAPMVAPGLFEQCHHLGEIQQTLINLYEEPEHMKDLIKYLVDFELELAEGICSHLKPDALFHHDDWGSQTSTFMSKDMFEEFYLDGYKQVYGYYKDHGVELIVHHSDSYAATFVPFMIDMGVDIWQGVMSSNNIPELIKQYGGKISFMGGIDSAKIDFDGSTREIVHEVAEKACRENGTQKKYYIPCNTMGGPSTIFPGVYEMLSEEIDKISKEFFPG